MDYKAEADFNEVDPFELKKRVEEKVRKRLMVIAEKMVKNLTASNPVGYTLPQYRSKPGGGQYFSNDIGGNFLSAALRDTKNQINIEIGPIVSLGVGKVSALDAATRMNKPTGPHGYWALFEGYDQYDGKTKVGGSKNYIFMPNGYGSMGQGTNKGPYNISLAGKYHPGVTPVHMFELTKKAYTHNFRRSVRAACVEAIKEFYKG